MEARFIILGTLLTSQAEVYQGRAPGAYLGEGGTLNSVSASLLGKGSQKNLLVSASEFSILEPANWLTKRGADLS